MRKLQLTSGPAAGQELELEQELVIGRENADLVLPDEEMSRRHVALRPVVQGVEVEDLGSLNGTFVDGQRISAPVTIAIRGSIKVGTSVIKVDVSLPQTTEAAVSPDQSTRARDIPAPSAPTVARDVPAPPPAAIDQPTAARAQPPAAADPPATEQEEGNKVESPHLPIPASAAIFIGALIVVLLLLLLFD